MKMPQVNRANVILAACVFALAVIGLIVVNYPLDKKQQLILNGLAKSQRNSSQTFKTQKGWHDGKEIQYYDFGQSRDNLGKKYILIRGFNAKEKPITIPGQKEIFSSKRSDKNYSDFWEIVYVTVPSKYQSGSIRSADELKKQNWYAVNTGEIANEPQILKDDKIIPDKAKKIGWCDNREIYTWEFNKNIKKNTSDNSKVNTQNVFILVHKNNSTKDLEEIENQKRIFDTIPTDEEYSPLRQVMVVEVPEDYKPNTLKSTEDILNSSYPIYSTEIYLNLPISIGS